MISTHVNPIIWSLIINPRELRARLFQIPPLHNARVCPHHQLPHITLPRYPDRSAGPKPQPSFANVINQRSRSPFHVPRNPPSLTVFWMLLAKPKLGRHYRIPRNDRRCIYRQYVKLHQSGIRRLLITDDYYSEDLVFVRPGEVKRMGKLWGDYL